MFSHETVHCEIVKCTDQAILIDQNGCENWVPKSKVDNGFDYTESDEGTVASLEVETWVCEEKELEIE